MDRLTVQQRSALMKRVRRSNTEPELKVRKALHRHGLRYVIGDKRLPGSPDLVFPKHRVVIFVHGCFWHGHTCRQGRAPATRREFWVPKIEGNKKRDERKYAQLRELGWRVFTVWECRVRNLDQQEMMAFAAELRERIAAEGCRTSI